MSLTVVSVEKPVIGRFGEITVEQARGNGRSDERLPKRAPRRTYFYLVHPNPIETSNIASAMRVVHAGGA